VAAVLADRVDDVAAVVEVGDIGAELVDHTLDDVAQVGPLDAEAMALLDELHAEVPVGVGGLDALALHARVAGEQQVARLDDVRAEVLRLDEVELGADDEVGVGVEHNARQRRVHRDEALATRSRLHARTGTTCATARDDGFHPGAL
jgi:hypothetical protein